MRYLSYVNNTNISFCKRALILKHLTCFVHALHIAIQHKILIYNLEDIYIHLVTVF